MASQPAVDRRWQCPTAYAQCVRTDREQRHAFISYVREDARLVDRLQRMLNAAGVAVWRDTADLWPGENWKSEIRKAISVNALAFIACFSERSLARERSYQNEELLLAAEELRMRPADHPWLVPVRFSNCALPTVDLGAGRSLESLQRIDLIGENWDEGGARLVAGVLRILGDSYHAASPRGTVDEKFMSSADLDVLRRQADIRILNRLREQFPGSLIRWVREWDFGNSWTDEQQGPFFDYARHYKDIEEGFLDDDLESLRKGFGEAVDRFALGLTGDSGPSRHGRNLYNVLDKGDRDRTERGHQLWEERRSRLNDLSGPVAASFDALLALARIRLPESIESGPFDRSGGASDI